MIKTGSGELLRNVAGLLKPNFGNEANSLAMILLEDHLDLSATTILQNSEVHLSVEAKAKLDHFVEEILENKPIQHVLGWAHFYDHKFKVNEHTLIPRQETEELVQAISKLIKINKYKNLLDIGTGSGCIAISLAMAHPNLEVSALDISEAALKIAQENAATLEANIILSVQDIFNYTPSKFDVIVSNPPYVLDSERQLMAANVLDHEPELALFVSDEEPLKYYKRITEIASESLNSAGLLYFEINEQFGPATVELMQKYGFKGTKINKDLNGKDRFVYGFKE